MAGFGVLPRRLLRSVSRSLIEKRGLSQALSFSFRVGCRRGAAVSSSSISRVAAASMSSGRHTSTSVETLGALTVRVLPALHDNYMYLVEDPVTREAAVVDPVEPEKVSSEYLHAHTHTHTHSLTGCICSSEYLHACTHTHILSQVVSAVKDSGVTLTTVLTTHHHWSVCCVCMIL